MNATNIQPTGNTTLAGVPPAPSEAHQRAGVEGQETEVMGVALRAVIAAVRRARDAAFVEANEKRGFRGLLVSRGVFVVVTGADGKVIRGQAESWPFVGRHPRELRAIAKWIEAVDVRSVHLTGGIDWSASAQARAAGDIEPMVAQWCVELPSLKAATH